MILKYYQIEVFPSLDYEIDYNLETETLIVDYELPNLDQMPQYKGYKFIKSTYTIQPIRLSDSARSKIYDDTIYKIILRIIYTLYKTDFNNYLKSVVLNGYVKFLDKATGKPNVACIASIQTIKEPFMEIDLAHVDPKPCFKSMKGICSSKLSTIVPITPVISLNKQDKRFISPYSVAEKIDSSTNLAAMDWEDFENLIRELFEQEFSSSGGEVKITQASRDGGVDAIAFDPDPIRGGKIVIQAKRYTNTVGVSAVRDLYGTLLNEGANRGILVTTSDYGPDSYDFAKGKPITLLNGGHLLSLLEKHGQKARIDIKEAKLLLNNDSNYHN
jgi:restriction system protein